MNGRDPVRLLGRGPGYTTRPTAAMHDEPEAVDDQALAGIGRAAERTETARYDELLEQRRQMPEVDRLRIALRDAEVRRVDVSKDMRVIRQRVEKIEMRLYRPVRRAA